MAITSQRVLLIVFFCFGFFESSGQRDPKTAPRKPATNKIFESKGVWKSIDVPAEIEKAHSFFYQDDEANIYLFSQDNDSHSDYFHKWNGSTWTSIPAPNGRVTGLAVGHNGVLYAWYNSGAYGGPVYKWNGKTWDIIGSFDKSVHAVAESADGKVYVGGEFRNAKDKCYVACYDAGKWVELGNERSHLDANAYIRTICTTPGGIFVAGAFSDNNKRTYVAHWNGQQWEMVGDNNSCAVFAGGINHILADAKGILFATGYGSGTSGKSLARYQSGKWAEILPDSIMLTSSAEEMIADKKGDLYVAGSFHNKNSNTNFSVAGWNGSRWDNMAAEDQQSLFGSSVRTLAVDNAGNLLAAGYLTNEFGKNFIAKWDVNETRIVGRSKSGHYPIPVANTVNLSPGASAKLKNMEIFEVDHKQGVRTITGTVLINPVFKCISLVGAPDFEKNYERPYAFRLENYSVNLVEFDNFEDGLHSYKEKYEKCSFCDGKGKFEEKHVLSYTPEESKTETHSTKEYTSWGDTRIKTTTTTRKTPEKTEYHTTTKICDHCKGSGKIKKLLLYVWDPKNKEYIDRWY